MRTIAILIGVVVACASCGSSTRNSTAPSYVFREPATLTIKVVVVNRDVAGTAIALDFHLDVQGDEAQPNSFQGSEGAQVLVEAHGSYSLNFVGPEGYNSQLSGLCSGLSGEKVGTCTLILTEIPLTCDEALWTPTYSRGRLLVLSPCEVEAMEVMSSGTEADADITVHGRTRTNRLLRPGNQELGVALSEQGETMGLLQVEVPCQTDTFSQTGEKDEDDPRKNCQGFNKQLRLAGPPPIGSFIAAAAHWVIDLRHGNEFGPIKGWAELHGARIRRIPRLKLP